MVDSTIPQTCPMCGEPVTRDTFDCPQCGESLRLDLKRKYGRKFERTVAQKFHSEARALAGFWIIGSLLSLFAGWKILSSGVRELMFYSSREVLVLIALAFILSGIAFLLSGVLTARKNLQAVRIGLQVTCLSMLINLLLLNVLGIMALYLVVEQSRRVLENGRILREAGLLD